MDDLPDSPLRVAGTATAEHADVETASDDYARRFGGSVGRWFLDRQSMLTRELLADVRAGATVLDVGGGHAQIAPVLIEAGFEVTVLGSDPSCATRLAPWVARGACRFDIGDLLALPYAPGAFDIVVSFRLLPHVSAWPRLLGELCRVARSVVVVDYPSRQSVNVLAGRLFGLKQRIERNTRPFALFHPDEIARAFADRGFRVTARRPQFFWPMALHRLFGSAALSRAIEWPSAVVGLRNALGSPVVLRAEPAEPLGQNAPNRL